MKIITHILVIAFILLLLAQFVPGITISNLYVALLAALVLGVLNAVVRPVLFILTLPITILTLGLFSFVINAALFLLAASFVSGFSVSGFLPALVGSAIVSLATTAIGKL